MSIKARPRLKHVLPFISLSRKTSQNHLRPFGKTRQRASDGDASDNDELYDDTINMEEMRDLFDESEEEEVFLGIDNED